MRFLVDREPTFMGVDDQAIFFAFLHEIGGMRHSTTSQKTFSCDTNAKCFSMF